MNPKTLIHIQFFKDLWPYGGTLMSATVYKTTLQTVLTTQLLITPKTHSSFLTKYNPLSHSTNIQVLFYQKMATFEAAFVMLLLLMMLQNPIFVDSSYDDVFPSEDEWLSATATYITEANASIINGACGYGDLHKATYGRYGTGLSSMLFNKGSVCGACFEIRCVDHIRWCQAGSPSVFVTATDYCPPNYGLSAEYGGWCNFPNEHFEMSEDAFSEIAVRSANLIPIQYRRVDCERDGGIRFTVTGNENFYQVLITNVGFDGEVVGVKIKGSRTGWIPMARNWGQYWQSNLNLKGQPLSFEVTTSSGKSVKSFNVAPKTWHFGQTFEGRQIYS
ncbi:hypothetical protein RND81_11G159500 [Saponaria officinalis]|uniref:Expansin n=1 Tax=Saponaria officinalis TaxID=3572 RepID=A0AAW1HPB2_SAPOF